MVERVQPESGHGATGGGEFIAGYIGLAKSQTQLNYQTTTILGWPKNLFGFFHSILQENPMDFLANPVGEP